MLGSKQGHNPTETGTANIRNHETSSRSVWTVWTWIGIGTGGTVFGLWLGIRAIVPFGLHGFLFGLPASGLVFATAVCLCDSPLSRKAAIRAAITSGLAAGAMTFVIAQQPLLAAVTFSVPWVIGATVPEYIYWERRDQDHIRETAARCRGVSQKLDRHVLREMTMSVADGSEEIDWI